MVHMRTDERGIYTWNEGKLPASTSSSSSSFPFEFDKLSLTTRRNSPRAPINIPISLTVNPDFSKFFLISDAFNSSLLQSIALSP